MQAWMIQNRRDNELYVNQNQDYSGEHVFIPTYRPWYAHHEYPHVFFDNEEASEAILRMDVPEDWKIVEVEIAVKN